MNSSQQITKISVALLKAQQTMGTAHKGSINPFFKSAYADLNAIREVAIPALNEQGIVVLQPTTTNGAHNFVETILLHESGEWITGVTEIKNTSGKPQDEGSGISYARRYGLQSILNIGAVDDDGEAAQGRTNEKTTQVVKTEVKEKPSTVQMPRPTSGIKPTGVNGVLRPTTVATNKPTKDKVSAIFKALKAHGKTDAESFKKTYLEGTGLSKLTEDQAVKALAKVKSDFADVYTQIQTQFPELGL